MSDFALNIDGPGSWLTEQAVDKLVKPVAFAVGAVGTALIVDPARKGLDAYGNYIDAGEARFLASQEEGQRKLDNLKLFHAYKKKFERDLEVQNTAAFSKFFATKAGEARLKELGITIPASQLIAEVKAGNYKNIPKSLKDGILKTQINDDDEDTEIPVDLPNDDSDEDSGLTNGQVRGLRSTSYSAGYDEGYNNGFNNGKPPKWHKYAYILLGIAAGGAGGWGATQLTQVSSLNSAIGVKDSTINGNKMEIDKLKKDLAFNEEYYQTALKNKGDELGIQRQTINQQKVNVAPERLRSAPLALKDNAAKKGIKLPDKLNSLIEVMKAKANEIKTSTASSTFNYDTAAEKIANDADNLLNEFRVNVQLMNAGLSPLKELYAGPEDKRNIMSLPGKDVKEKISGLGKSIPLTRLSGFVTVPVYESETRDGKVKAGDLIPLKILQDLASVLEGMRQTAKPASNSTK